MKTFKLLCPSQEHPHIEKELYDFCSIYPQKETQQELWRWFIFSLKQDYDGLSSTRTTNLITFYENLKKLVSAVYQLHDLSAEAGQEDLTEEAPALGPIAAALESLHHNMPHNWTLLICPPE